MLDSLRVRYGKRSRHAEANRTNLRVRLATKLVSAAAKHFAHGFELDVTLDADDRLVGGVHARTSSSDGLRARACRVARSYACATPSKSFSP